MRVRELIGLLETCDPESIVIVRSHGIGRVELTTLEIMTVGGLGNRKPSEFVNAVELTDLNGPFLERCGLNVKHVQSSEEPVHFTLEPSLPKESDEYSL